MPSLFLQDNQMLEQFGAGEGYPFELLPLSRVILIWQGISGKPSKAKRYWFQLQFKTKFCYFNKKNFKSFTVPHFQNYHSASNKTLNVKQLLCLKQRTPRKTCLKAMLPCRQSLHIKIIVVIFLIPHKPEPTIA